MGFFPPPFETAERFDFELFEVFAGDQFVSGTHGRFHDAAAGAEEFPGGTPFAERGIGRLGFEFAEVDAVHLKQLRGFAGGQHGVDVLIAVAAEFGTRRFELLGGAGHDRDRVDLLRVDADLFGVARFDDRAEHSLRGFAGREVRKHFGIGGFGELDPAGRAAGEHRQNAAVGDAVHQFGRLFHNGQVGAERGVEHGVEPDFPQCGVEHAHHVGAERQVELFAERNRNGGRVLYHNVQVRVVQGGNDLLNIVLGGERAGRARGHALAAVDAAGDVHSFVERVADERFRAAADVVEAGDRLNVFADAHAAAAKDAFARVAHNRRTRFVDRTVVLFAGVAVAAHTQLDRKGLQFAAAVPFAVEAVGRMVRQEEFKNGAARFDDARRVGFDLHAVGNRERAGGNQRALAFDFADAHTAGAGRRKTFHITEGRNFDPRAIQSRQQHFAGFGFDRFTVDFNVNHGVYSLSCESCFCITVWRWR